MRPLKLLESQRPLGGVTALRIGPMNIRIVNDPDLLHEILVARTKDFVRSGPVYEVSRAFVGNGLAMSEGAWHRRQRRMMQPAFRRSRMPDYHVAMREGVEQMTGRWQPGQRIDIWDELFNLTVGIVGNTLALGSFDQEKTEQIASALRVASRGIGWRMATPVEWVRSLPTPENRRFTRAQAQLREMGRQVLAEHRERSDADSEDFLSLLLAARDEEEQPLSEQQLVDEVVMLFSAGGATSATSLSWAFDLLSKNPDVEERARAEVQEVLGGKPVTPEDLPRLEYLGRVLTEVLRLYPAVWLLPRLSVTDTEVGGHHIPKNTLVFHSSYAIQRDPKLYAEPEKFDPDRWLPDRRTGQARNTYLPFGAGVHQCIGDSYALTESLIALAAILAKWNLRRDPAARVRMRTRGLLEPHGLTLIAEKPEGANK
jgi:pentalenene oxygenase